MQIAWHLLHEKGAQARLADGRLYMGNALVDADLALVDDIQRLTGGVATVFKGDERVTTNVLGRNGTRGIGTHLASAAVRDTVLQQQKPFRGVVDVLGQQYYSGYDPITDRDGHVIGILYVGLKQSEVTAAVTRLSAMVAAVSCGAALVAELMFQLFGRRLSRLITMRERSLAAANAHLDTALATMANGLCLWDADNRLVLANARLCEMLGLPPEQVVPGMPYREFLRLRDAAGNFADSDADERYAKRLAVIARRQPESQIDISATGRIVSWQYRPIAAGGWVATYEDVTEQRAAERARAATEADLLRERKRLAEDASRAKSAFLAMMSHEIRTPMNAVLGLADRLLDGSLPPEQHRMVEAIHDSGDILLRILNDILDFTKLEAGRMTLEEAPFSPVLLTHSVSSVLGPQAVGKGLTIDADCDPSVPAVVVGDAGRIRQILLNLASNAVKFTETGSVSIRATCMSRGADAATVRWTVSDTGIGIPADRIGSLFGDFVQADSSITRRFGGSGLGLAISKRLVEQMGGDIGVDSAPSHGTTFRVDLTLPVSAQPPNTGPKPADRTSAFLALLEARDDPLRILLAEDNATNQMVARMLLKDLNLTLDVVGDGREAVEAAANFPYDVIFMDMRMPEMDGLQAARLIRRKGGRFGSVPIIALTANVFAEDIKACLDAGMNQFVPKPVSKELLLTAMYEALTDGTAAARLPDQGDLAPPARIVCDQAALAALRCEIGAPAVAEMIEVFEADARARLRTMAASLHDRPALLREAHSLRGAAGAACAPALADMARDLEIRLKAGVAVSDDEVALMATAFDAYLTIAEPEGRLSGQVA